MQTECPHCHTVFHVIESELEQADGQVRCGHCLAIFTADNPYRLINYPAATAEEAPDTVEVEIHSEAIADPDKEQDEDQALNLAMDSGLGLDLSPDKTEETIIAADVIPPELRAESRQGKARFSHTGTALLTLSILASIAAGIFQYAYYNRNNLIKMTELRPLYEFTCKLARCTLPAPKDVSLIVLGSKNIFTHPNTENALMVTVSIVNQANFEQNFPVIELSFENVRGEVIAARRFYAEEYLGIPKEQIPKMQPDTPVSINLEIKDPGSEMVSYEFAFL